MLSWKSSHQIPNRGEEINEFGRNWHCFGVVDWKGKITQRWSKSKQHSGIDRGTQSTIRSYFEIGNRFSTQHKTE